jgi:hypothetical protein
MAEDGQQVEGGTPDESATVGNTRDLDLAVAMAIAMPSSIWQVSEVRDQPEVTLIEWSIREIHPRGTRHFVGYHPSGREGRVSSAILEFDPVSRQGRTKSGRVYLLFGAPGLNQNAEYVWENWRHIQGAGAATWLDVTQEITAR